MFPLTANAQSVGVGHSVKLWGATTQTAEINVKFKNFSAHYFYNYKAKNYSGEYYSHEYYLRNEQQYRSKDSSAFGISFTPINIWYVSVGGIATNNKFPTYDGTKLNFILSFELPIKL